MKLRGRNVETYWNVVPRNKFLIPATNNPLVNAARAIAVSAYPNPKDHLRAGKAEKYSSALLARIFRLSKSYGYIEALPPWAREVRVEAMERNLVTGYRNLLRALTIRDLINSALTMRTQYDNAKNGRSVTFTLQYSPDLKGIKIEAPVQPTVSGYILSGKIPDTRLASIRAAVLYHEPALREFQGPAVKIDGRDKEFDYQNVYNRHIRPALFAQHIVQVVWEQVSNLAEEAMERDIALDEMLMRQPDWAVNIHTKTAEGLGRAIFNMRRLGVPTCWCEMVRFDDPLPDS